MDKAFFPIALGLVVSMALLRADDLTLNDGTVLKNAKIVQRDDSKKTVTVSFSGGIAQVNPEMMPASLATTQQPATLISPNPSIPAPEPTNVPSSNIPIPKDWTVGGKTFHNVTVTKVDPDLVHILYDGGAGSVPLASLAPDLQKKFGYDPAAAAQAAQQRQQQEAASDAMVQSVNAQQAKQAQASATPPTFQDKVMASRNARRLSLENEIKMRTDTLENLEAAAQAGGDAADQKSIAYNIASQKVQIAKLQAELATIP